VSNSHGAIVLLCSMPKTNSNVKTISPGGQISLGKKYAGQQVLVEQIEEGFWTIKTAITIPTNEQWLWQEPFKSKLEASLKWAATHPAQATNLDELEQKIIAHHETRDVVLK
jgi:hypothetical protein